MPEAEATAATIEARSDAPSRRPAARAGRRADRGAFARSLGFPFHAAILPRLIVGSVSLIVINTLLYGFVTWLPTFFVQQGMSVSPSRSTLRW